MKKPFTTQKIKMAVKALKNGKSTGIDNLDAELIKCSPDVVCENISEIETGQYPSEIKEGVLMPLPKPGKKTGPAENLRPIILLSILRKILAICMLRRCLDKLLEGIPTTQAAYQQGRSTAELVFSFKVLAEKAITSENYKIFLLLLDMSKDFDTVRRSDLFTILEDILEADELHMMKILLEDVILRVKIGKKTGEAIKTNIGIPQGGYLSLILFILYLAQALKLTRTVANPRHLDSTKMLMIDQQYADDVSWITDHDETVLQLKKEVPSILKEKNLQTCVGKQSNMKLKEIAMTPGKNANI